MTDAESSPQEIGAEVKTEAPDVKPAESSAADASAKPEKGEKDDILSAVKAALKPSEEKPPVSKEPDSKSEEKPESDKADEGDESDELTEEEKTHLHTKTRKRIDRLLTQRAERDQTIAETKPKAEQFDRIVNFVAEANLSPTEVNDLFDTGKALKNDPRKAWERLKPIMHTLNQMFGEVLPDDLQRQVNVGAMTAEAAKELAVARTNAAVAQQQVDRTRAQDETRRQNEQQQTHVAAVQTEVSKWESSKEKSDPDWNLKRPQVMRAVKLALMEKGVPPSPADAVTMAEEALKAVNEEFKGLAPRRKEITPITDVASTRSTAKPTSALEAAKQALAKSRTG